MVLSYSIMFPVFGLGASIRFYYKFEMSSKLAGNILYISSKGFFEATHKVSTCNLETFFYYSHRVVLLTRKVTCESRLLGKGFSENEDLSSLSGLARGLTIVVKWICSFARLL